MKKLIVLALTVTPFFMVFSCRHEPVLPDHQVSFSADILPIIQSSCQHSGCHDPLPGHEAFPITDYQQVIHECDVVAGKPHESKLYEVITAPEGSEDRMPQSPYPALTDRNMRLIYIWIAQGAKNN